MTLKKSEFTFFNILTENIPFNVFQVMPAMLSRVRPAEEGWSKPHADDLMEKSFTTTFPAFKFPDRERLHVSCGVQLCRDDCPYVSLMFNV